MTDSGGTFQKVSGAMRKAPEPPAVTEAFVGPDTIMHIAISRLARFVAVPRDNPELLRAQFTALSRMIPLMYLILVVNAGVLAVVYFGSAPIWLTEPRRICRRPQLVRSRVYDKQNDEQILS